MVLIRKTCLLGLFIMFSINPVWALSEAEGDKMYRAGFYLEALQHWEDAARAGDAGAAFRAGVEYFDAKIVKRDLKKALHYWTMSADGNDPRGLSDLAALYDYGNGVSVDRKKAARLYGRAARQGFPDAMFNFASMLASGEGIKKDLVEAYKYFLLAAQKGFGPFTSAALSDIEKHLSAEQIAEAQRRAEAFQPSAPE